MTNKIKYYTYASLYSLGLMFCSGAIIQTFLLQIGFSEERVYLFNSLIQIAQLSLIFAMIFFSNRIKRVKLVVGWSYCSLGVLSAVFLFGAINPEIMSNIYVIVVFLTAAISYGVTGINTVLSYCLPYYIIDMKEYGKLCGTSAIISGIVSISFSSLYTFLVSKFNYMQTMTCALILAIICFILTTVICLSLKEIEEQRRQSNTTKADMIAVFKNKDTYILLLPNFARGLSTGIMSAIAVLTISMKILNEQTSAYISVIMPIASFAASALYILLLKKISSNTFLLISTIGYCILFPLSICGGIFWFLILFFFTYLFRIISDTTIPVLITEIIPQNQIGAYTSIRMLIFTGAQAVANLMILPIVNQVGYLGLLIFASIMQFICGISYYWAVRKNKKLQAKSS